MCIKSKEKTESRSKYWQATGLLVATFSNKRFLQLRKRSLISMGWTYIN